MIIFSINFNIFFLILIGNIRQALKSEELRVFMSVLAVSALTLVGCTDNGDDATTTGTATATETTAAADATDATAEGENAEWVTFTEGFVKAKPAEKDMTGIFGIFTNNSDEDINVVGFTSNLDVPTHELHEVVDGVMQMKPGGFVLPAGEEYELKPGGDHMMLMDYTEPIEAGDTIDIVLEFGDAPRRRSRTCGLAPCLRRGELRCRRLSRATRWVRTTVRRRVRRDAPLSTPHHPEGSDTSAMFSDPPWISTDCR